MEKILEILQGIIENIKKLIQEQKTIVTIPPIDNIPIEIKDIPKYIWSTKKDARHSVRVICDEEGLTLQEKNLICAVIDCESGFDVKAKYKNIDGTYDIGICQYNTYWYIGVGKPIASVEEALNNPEKCVRIMIHQYKNGQLRDWICYRTGKYRKFLV